MAGVASNEPYQRVSRDNGVFDGMLIGMAVAAGGASAGVFGARMHYNGIDRRVERDRARLESQLETQKQKAQRLENKFNRVSQNAGPRIWERRGYNRGLEAEERIMRQGRRLENALNQNRQRDIEALQQTASSSIDDTVARAMERHPSANPENIRQHNIDVNAQRNEYLRQVNEINNAYDRQINELRQGISQRLDQNKDVRYKNKVQNNIEKRVNNVYNKYTKSVQEAVDTARLLNEMNEPGYVDKMRSKHIYGRHMGGWKNAAIIGASAVIGGGLGMLADAAID